MALKISPGRWGETTPNFSSFCWWIVCLSSSSLRKSWVEKIAHTSGKKNMVMKFHGNVRGNVRVNFLALFALKPHIFMHGALKLSGIVRANVRLNIAIPMLLGSLNRVLSRLWLSQYYRRRLKFIQYRTGVWKCLWSLPPDPSPGLPYRG